MSAPREAGGPSLSPGVPRPTLVSHSNGRSLDDALRPAPTVFLDELFAEITALPPRAREQVLRDRCADDPETERMLRAMLRSEVSGGGWASGSVPPRRSGFRLASGEVLGRYRLEEALGSGATASVWKAFDTHLHAFTALKILNPDAAKGPAALDAVLREARAASGVISDHVVRVKTAGRFEEGPSFVEMELCAEYRPGTDGTEVLEVGRNLADAELRDLEERVRIVAEAARGVDAAHRVGVLHRDLKPGNILLTPQSRRAKVTDFGLAADQVFPTPDALTAATETVTVLLEAQDGKVVGTPAYMAPEQALGHPPSRAADIYALGATLYALLLERPPYEPDGRHPIPALDVLAQVRVGPAKPIRERDERIPVRLARVIEKAMARSPRDRYRTAGDLARDLEAWLANRTTTVDGRAPALEAVLFARRQRALVASVAVLALTLLVFGGAVAFLEVRRRTLTEQIDDAEERLVQALGAARQAEAVRDRTEAERQRALLEAAQALADREKAREGEVNAEQRLLTEAEQRRLAEDARAAAEISRAAAERLRDEATTAARAVEGERDAALVERDRALEEATSSWLAAEESARERDEEVARRREAEEALALSERTLEVFREENLQLRVDLVEAAAREERLQAELDAARPAAVPTGP